MEQFLFGLGTLEKDLVDIIEPLLNNEGFELVRLKLARGLRESVLTLFIDKLDSGDKGGVVLDEITHASRFLSDALDALGTDNVVLSGKYTLEVSSPGLDRPLSKLSHFNKAIDQEVKLSLITEIKGSKKWTGHLTAVNEQSVILEPKGSEESLEIPFQNMAKANVVFRF